MSDRDLRVTNYQFACLALLSVLFWLLRLYYWGTHTEEPFSDILGYVRTADSIVSELFFGVDPTRTMYYTPVTPLVIAFAKIISAGHYIWVFRFLVQLAVFVGALALVRELTLVTGRKWLGISFLFVLAICRPSIFWSLKLATETVCEALLYITAALALAAIRTRSVGLAFACGIACLALGLNRPNFIPGALMISLAFLTSGFLTSRISRTGPTSNASVSASGARKWWQPRDRRALLLIGVFVVGFFGMWSLWIGRNVINYGTFVPTSVSGMVTMNWDYSGIAVRVGRYDALTLADGSKYDEFNINKLVPHVRQLPDDRARAIFLGMLTNAWFSANWMDLPKVFLLRLKHYVAERGPSGLTTVSREDLFPAPTPGYNNPYAQTGWLNLILLDKTPTACFLGLVGLIFLTWRVPGLSPVFVGLALMPWLSGAVALGYERTVESMIPLTLWFALYGMAELASHLQRLEDRTLPADPLETGNQAAIAS